MKKSLQTKHLIIVITGLLFVDQISKYLTKTYMVLGQHINIIGDFFMLTYVENPGMAFGLRMENNFLFLSLSLIAAALVFYYLFKLRKEQWPLQIAISMIAAGAIGNLTDRFLRGSVVDFFDFEFFDVVIPAFNIFGMDFSGYSMTRWPVFNIADMAVSAGMVILFSFILLNGDPLKETVKKKSGQTSTDVN